MATRRKTLIYHTKLDADVADATVTNLDQITIKSEYASASRSFKSVLIYISFQDIITATGGTISEHRCGVSVDGAGYTTTTEVDDIGHSGENIAGTIGPFDFTAHFNTNYSADDTATLDIQVYFSQSTGTTLGMRNVNAKIVMTYEFDDSGVTTQYETFICPLESPTAALATTETEIGTNQVPQLTGSGGIFENVTGFTVQQQAFVVQANSQLAGNTTDPTLNLRIGTGTTKTFNATEAALATDSWMEFVYLESPATTAAYAFSLWSTGAGRFNCAAATMYVTYSYTPTANDKSIQSILLPFQLPITLGQTADGDQRRVRVEVMIEEPGTISLLQSAVYVIAGAISTETVQFRMGSQAYRAYTINIGLGGAAGMPIQQRIDSGGAQGAGVTLARGKNTITIDLYASSAVSGSVGYVVLNYRSDVTSGARNTHNRTVWTTTMAWDALTSVVRDITPTAPGIPETDYYVNAIGYLIHQWANTDEDVSTLSAKPASGEGVEAGFSILGQTLGIQIRAERGSRIWYVDASGQFDRFTNDPDTSRMAIETNRAHRHQAPFQVCAVGIVCFVTYHSITKAIAGTISGSAGGTVNIDAYRTDTGSKVGSTSRSGNGSYSIPWYDDTLTVFARAYESTTLKGVSVEDEGGNTFDINVAAPGGGMIVHSGMTGGMRG